jgi:hypothetical protein
MLLLLEQSIEPEMPELVTACCETDDVRGASAIPDAKLHLLIRRQAIATMPPARSAVDSHHPVRGGQYDQR